MLVRVRLFGELSVQTVSLEIWSVVKVHEQRRGKRRRADVDANLYAKLSRAHAFKLDDGIGAKSNANSTVAKVAREPEASTPTATPTSATCSVLLIAVNAKGHANFNHLWNQGYGPLRLHPRTNGNTCHNVHQFIEWLDQLAF